MADKGTFRGLIGAFYRAGHADYCDEVIKVMSEDSDSHLQHHSHPLDLKTLEKQLKNVIKWDKLGKCLGISHQQIESIRKEFSADGEREEWGGGVGIGLESNRLEGSRGEKK